MYSKTVVDTTRQKFASVVRRHQDDLELTGPAFIILNVLEQFEGIQWMTGPRKGDSMYEFVTAPSILEKAGHLISRAMLEKGLEKLEELGYVLYVGKKALSWPHVQGRSGPRAVDCWDVFFDRDEGSRAKLERKAQGFITEKPKPGSPRPGITLAEAMENERLLSSSDAPVASGDLGSGEGLGRRTHDSKRRVCTPEPESRGLDPELRGLAFDAREHLLQSRDAIAKLRGVNRDQEAQASGRSNSARVPSRREASSAREEDVQRVRERLPEEDPVKLWVQRGLADARRRVEQPSGRIR